MRKWLIKFCNKFALWILHKTGGIVALVNVALKQAEEIEKVVPLYVERARQLVQEIDSVKESGEYKRHQIYAKLIKEFPEIRKRDLGLAIEVGIQKL